MSTNKPGMVYLAGGFCVAALLGTLFSGYLPRSSTSPPSERLSEVHPSNPVPFGPDAARTASIRATMEGIREECRRNADGDWDRWQERTSPYRADLDARIRAARPYQSTADRLS